jgi:hypothetical protein
MMMPLPPFYYEHAYICPLKLYSLLLSWDRDNNRGYEMKREGDGEIG